MDRAAVWGVAVVTAVSPYFRGLYFPGEQLVAVGALVALAAAYVAGLPRVAAPHGQPHPMDLAVASLAAAYVLGLAVAVDRRLALQGALVMVALGAAYGIVGHGVRGRDEVRAVAYLIAWTGVWVAGAGVAAAAGQFAMADAVQGSRLASVFQYPNTLAAYLGMAVLIALGLWQGSTARAGRWLAAVSAYLCLFVLVFTYSRGGWIVFALVAAVFPLVQPGGLRLLAALRLSALVAVLVPAAVLYTRVATDPVGAWAAFLGGVPAVLALDALALRVLGLSRGRRAVAVAGLAACTLAAVTVAVIRVGAVPAELAARIASIRLDDYSAWSRIAWSRDALRMIADRPVLGGGAGAWQALYQGYQSWAYYSTQVHNHFLQLWLETGIVGFAAWLGLWCAMAVTAIRTYRRAESPGERALVAGLVLGAAVLGLHSLIDFNLSLMAVALTLWTLFGLVRALDRIQTSVGVPVGSAGRVRARGGGSAFPKAVVVGASALLVALSGSLWLGYWHGQRGVQAMKEGRLEDAARHFERALRFDPLTASFKFDRALLLERLQPDDPVALARARRLMEQGLALSPRDPNLHAVYGGFLLRRGEFDAGMAAIQRAAELHPFAAERWENVAVGHAVVAQILLARGDVEDGRRHLQGVLSAARRLADFATRVPPQVPEFMRTPATTPLMELAVGEAHAMLGEEERARQHLERALAQLSDPRQRAEVMLWLAALADWAGKAQEAARWRQEATAAAGVLPDEFDGIRALVGAAR